MAPRAKSGAREGCAHGVEGDAARVALNKGANAFVACQRRRIAAQRRCSMLKASTSMAVGNRRSREAFAGRRRCGPRPAAVAGWLQRAAAAQAHAALRVEERRRAESSSPRLPALASAPCCWSPRRRRRCGGGARHGLAARAGRGAGWRGPVRQQARRRTAAGCTCTRQLTQVADSSPGADSSSMAQRPGGRESMVMAPPAIRNLN